MASKKNLEDMDIADFMAEDFDEGDDDDDLDDDDDDDQEDDSDDIEDDSDDAESSDEINEDTKPVKGKDSRTPSKQSKQNLMPSAKKGQKPVAVTKESKKQNNVAKSSTDPEEKSKGSVIDQHKKSIESLKEKDPEFYKFLQENDQELLDFDDSGSSDEDEEEGDMEKGDVDGADDDDDEDSDDIQLGDSDFDSDSEEEGGRHRLPKKLEEASDKEESDSEDDEGSSKVSGKGTVVTMAMVDKWADLIEESNLHAFKELVEAFKAAVYGMPDEREEEEEEVQFKYAVTGSKVFNAIISLCLKGVEPMLQNVVKLDAKAIKRLALPTSSKDWKNVYVDVREYLLQVIQLLTHMVDPAIVCVVLQHIHKVIPYFCCFPKMTRSLIKKLVPLWSTGEETVRVVAFLGLHSIARYMKKPQWLEHVLKQMYMAYVKNTKFTSPSTLPLITFMQRSLTEMFALNTQVTYQHAFVYIRQLAIHLRNAITIKKDQYQSVYNWQYIHCVWLWCRVLGTLHSDQSLQPLIYPLVQTAVGVIKLIPAAKYIPLRFSVVRALNILSDATGTFIPLLPHILDVFDLVDFNRRPIGVSYRPLNFAVVLKLSSKQIAEKGLKDGLIDEIYELILEHLVVHSHTISFPEFALPVILRLKAFIKASRVPSYSKVMKGLLDKVQENCKEITLKRDSVTFGLADDQAVRIWESKMKEKGTVISKLYTKYKPLRERELKTEEAGKERLLDMNFPTVAREKQRKMKEEDKEDFKELFEKDSDSEDDIFVRAERRKEKVKEERKEQRKRKKQQRNNLDDSDLDMSDDDDYDDDDFSDDSDDLEDDDDESEEEDMGSDGGQKVNKAAKAQRTKPQQKAAKKQEIDEDFDTMDNVDDVVEDFELWSDEDGEGGDGEGKKKSKKRKLDQGKGKGKSGKGKETGKAKFQGKKGKGKFQGKKPKLASKV